MLRDGKKKTAKKTEEFFLKKGENSGFFSLFLIIKKGENIVKTFLKKSLKDRGIRWKSVKN